MKNNNNTTASVNQSTDEFSGLYNWSERTAMFFHTKKQNQYRLFDSMIDLMCMAATTIAMVNCL